MTMAHRLSTRPGATVCSRSGDGVLKSKATCPTVSPSVPEPVGPTGPVGPVAPAAPVGPVGPVYPPPPPYRAMPVGHAAPTTLFATCFEALEDMVQKRFLAQASATADVQATHQMAGGAQSGARTHFHDKSVNDKVRAETPTISAQPCAQKAATDSLSFTPVEYHSYAKVSRRTCSKARHHRAPFECE